MNGEPVVRNGDGKAEQSEEQDQRGDEDKRLDEETGAGAFGEIAETSDEAPPEEGDEEEEVPGDSDEIERIFLAGQGDGFVLESL